MARWMRLAAVSFAAVLSGAAMAQAQSRLTASVYTGPKHPVSTGGYAPLIEKLEAGETYDVQFFEGGALLDAKPSLGGVRDGITDVTMLALTYFPAEFPHAQLVADMGLATPSNLVAMAAATEFNLLHCEPCLAEYAQQGTVYTGTYSTSPYTIISKEPIRTLADLNGKKMRVPGSLWSRWVQSVGGVEVNVPSSEMFEGLDKGALDIAIQSPGAFRSYGLWDAAKYMTDINLGTYHSLSLMTWNKDFWSDLTDEQRRMFLDEAARACVDATMTYTATDDEVLAAAAEHGVEVIPAPEEMTAAKDEFVQRDVDTVVAIARDQYGIADARPLIDEMRTLIDKWDGIVGEIGEDDRDGLIARLKSEVFDKLPDDYGTY